MNRLSIIVIAYNRPDAFSHMLDSLSRIVTSRKDICLVISLEGGATEDVRKIAENFIWPYGEKRVVPHESKLGLRNHFIWVGDQTETYDNVIFLEDDLAVSPYIIDAAEQLIENYSGDDRVAAGSFYSPLVCEFNAQRFYPIDDGGDTFFFQHPYWGNLWQKEKWRKFKEWLLNYKRDEKLLPFSVRGWKETSFKVVYIQYLIETERYVVFTRQSYVNNMGFAGLHNSTGSNTYQVPLPVGAKRLSCKSFDDAISIYDANFEITDFALKKANPLLSDYDFDVDLYKTGDNHSKGYILTKGTSRDPVISFHGGMKPYELAVAMNCEGDGIVLSKKEDMITDESARERWHQDYLNNNALTDRKLFYHIQDCTKLLMKRMWERLRKRT